MSHLVSAADQRQSHTWLSGCLGPEQWSHSGKASKSPVTWALVEGLPEHDWGCCWPNVSKWPVDRLELTRATQLADREESLQELYAVSVAHLLMPWAAGSFEQLLHCSGS